MDNVLYYYGDESGNSVGPLSLPEIWRFAEAGVIPRNVMVCQAGGDQWRSLETFYQGSVASLGQAILPALESSESRARTSYQLGIHFSHALLAEVIAMTLRSFSLRQAIEHGGIDPDPVRSVLMTLSMFWSIAALLVLIYQICKTLPDHLRFSTPLRAAGFYIIPVFSLYWIFRLFPGLAKATRQWAGDSSGPGAGWVGGLRRLGPLAMATAVVEVLAEITSLLDFHLSSSGVIASNPAGAKAVYAFVHLVYATHSTVLFFFLFSVVNVMRRILDPNYEERFAAQMSRLFGLPTIPWEMTLISTFLIGTVAIWLRR